MEGSRQIDFALFTVADGGTAACTASTNTEVQRGRFRVDVSTCAAAIQANPDTWVELKIGGVLLPRRKVGAAPYALEALRAQDATSLTGALGFFYTSTCPPGWVHFPNAAGRYVVGTAAAVAPGSVVGTALTNAENRAAGQHSHGITDPGHQHSYAAPNYTGVFGSGGATGSDGAAGASTGASSTNISINNFGTVAGTNAPYVQLRPCIKQ